MEYVFPIFNWLFQVNKIITYRIINYKEYHYYNSFSILFKY